MLISPLYSKMNINRNPAVNIIKMSTKRILDGFFTANLVASSRKTPVMGTCLL